MRQTVARAVVKVARAGPAAVCGAKFLGKAVRPFSVVRILALAAINSLVSSITEASSGSSIAVAEFSRAAIVRSVGEGAHHSGTRLARRGSFIQQLLVGRLYRSLVDALSLKVGRVAVNADEAGVVRPGIASIPLRADQNSKGQHLRAPQQKNKCQPPHAAHTPICTSKGPGNDIEGRRSKSFDRKVSSYFSLAGIPNETIEQLFSARFSLSFLPLRHRKAVLRSVTEFGGEKERRDQGKAALGSRSHSPSSPFLRLSLLSLHVVQQRKPRGLD